MNIKLICGYRKDQVHTVPIEEAHKAYHIFLNPEKRAVFSNGLAITGRQIEIIEPDYVGSMGWNPAHTPDADDWNEIHESGLTRKLVRAMNAAKEIAVVASPEELTMPLSRLIETKYQHLPNGARTYSTGEHIGALLQKPA